MRILDLCIKVGLIAGLFFLAFEAAWAGDVFPANSKVAQWLVEDSGGHKCAAASAEEVNQLKCRTSPGEGVASYDVDKMAEFLTLKVIANAEDDQQVCLVNQVRVLRDSPELQKHAMEGLCEMKDTKGHTKIEKLKEVVNKLEYFKRWLESYKMANDRLVRNIPEKEFDKNNETIKWLTSVVLAYEIEEGTLRDTDPLLSSPEIYREIRKQLADSKVLGVKVASGKGVKEACGYIKNNVTKLLNRQFISLDESHKNFHDKLTSNNSWLEDSKFKEKIWNSGVRDEQIKKLSVGNAFMPATYCRMNARYGEGARFRDGLYRIGAVGFVVVSFGASSAAQMLATAATTAGRAELIEMSVLASRTVMGIEFTAANTAAVANALEQCRPQVTALSTQKSCQSMSDSDFKTLYYNKVGANQCALSIGLTMGTAGLSTLALKSSLVAGLNNDLGVSGLSRILESEKILGSASAGMVVAAKAEATTINEALKITEVAWGKTRRYMKIYVDKKFPGQDYEQFIQKNPEFTEAVFDRYVSHGVLPLGPDRALRGTGGLRVVDAPQLESLEAKGVPKSIINHMTIDHHNSFGVGLPTGVNSTTQILDMISDPAIAPAEFNKIFSKFASDNIGDAFGLARAVVRNADTIRKDPSLVTKFKEIAEAEDFGIFGPGMDLKNNDTVAALLRLNDKTLPNLERTFMDRVSLNFGNQTKNGLDEMQNQLDRVLFPKSADDVTYVKGLASEFRQNVQSGIKNAEAARVVVNGSSGKPAPIFLADTTKLNAEANGQFEAWSLIPQYVRGQQLEGAQTIERSFTISGNNTAPTRTIILSNLSGQRSSLFEKVSGQNQSFAEAYRDAEKLAIEKRLSEGLKGADELAAKDRLQLIKNGTWVPQNHSDGSLIFGPTYMKANEMEQFVKTHAGLLGY